MIKILFNFICSSLSLFLIILRDYTKTKRFGHYIFQLLKSIDEEKIVASNVVGLDDVELMEIPGRKKRRDEAFKAQQKKTSQMKKLGKIRGIGGSNLSLFSEQDAVKLICKIMDALEYCHD